MVIADEADVVVRPIARAEMEVPLQWAAEEGWNPGHDDADAFHAADPRGFLMAFRDGDPIASISVRYSSDFGFLGLYIVRPDFRGLGYGLRLWHAGMQHLDGCVVGLDGVVAQQANYARSGFIYAHRNVRYSGRLPAGLPRVDGRLRAIDPDLTNAVHAYDRRFFPAERAAFLNRWLNTPHHRAFAVVEESAMRGYCVIRACRSGFKIGPLFADTPSIAEQLLLKAASEATGQPISIDVPEPNPEAVDLAMRLGLAPVFETARMYRGPAPALPLQSIYGITTLELG